MDAPEIFRVALTATTPQGTSRGQGKAARIWLRGLLDLHKRIELNLDGVKILTPSFADECFGKLLLELGEKGFRQNFRMRGGEKHVRRLLNRVLRQRLAELHRD